MQYNTRQAKLNAGDMRTVYKLKEIESTIEIKAI